MLFAAFLALLTLLALLAAFPTLYYMKKAKARIDAE